MDGQLMAGQHVSSTSSDWSGYAANGNTYERVSGTWVEPTVTCSAGETAAAAFWVGLDGDTSTSVEQIGTDSDCDRGTPTYYAWYELFPASPVQIAHPVKPGDTLSGTVTTDGTGTFTLSLRDTTARWTSTASGTSPLAELSSAEWIVEAPTNGRVVVPLADFGTVHFTHCTANGQAISANPQVDEIVLAAFDGTAEDQPSSLSGGGTAFSVVWKQSQPTAPSPHHRHPGHHGWWGGGWGWPGQPPAFDGSPWPGQPPAFDGSPWPGQPPAFDGSPPPGSQIQPWGWPVPPGM
jgi:hypothetical protein